MKLVNKALVAGIVALLSAPVVFADEAAATTTMPAAQATATPATEQATTTATPKKKVKAHKARKHKKEGKTMTKSTMEEAPASN